MKTRRYTMALIPLLALSVTGCNDLLNSIGLGSDEKEKVNTVLLDLATVVKETGQDKIIKEKLDKSKADITLKITEARQGIEEKIKEEREKLGKKPSDEKKANFQQIAVHAEQQLRNMQVNAQQQLRQHEASLLQELRSLIQPVAEKIAREKGAQSALVLNPSLVLWHDASIDITDEVIAALNANAAMPSDSPADMPADAAETQDTMTEGTDVTPDASETTNSPDAMPESPVTEPQATETPATTAPVSASPDPATEITGSMTAPSEAPAMNTK